MSARNSLVIGPCFCDAPPESTLSPTAVSSETGDEGLGGDGSIPNLPMLVSSSKGIAAASVFFRDRLRLELAGDTFSTACSEAEPSPQPALPPDEDEAAATVLFRERLRLELAGRAFSSAWSVS
jgi:hypothetical protein